MRHISSCKKGKRLAGKDTNVCAKTNNKKKSRRGRPAGYKMSETSKKKIAQSRVGYVVSEITKLAISESLIEYYSCLRRKGFVVARIIVKTSDKAAMSIIKGEKKRK